MTIFYNILQILKNVFQNIKKNKHFSNKENVLESLWSILLLLLL